jgi:hypothetical protein
VAITQFQPIVAYQLGRGWALSAGDLHFTYDWKRGGLAALPIGFQLRVVRKIVDQAFRISVNPQWNLRHITGADKATIVFGLTLLIPGG